MTGRLIGIARKPRPRAPVETMASADIGLAYGVAGDHRGRLKPGGRRQVTVMAAADWAAAMADLGRGDLAWPDRRVNLLTAGVVLPRTRGALLRVGGALFEVTGECDPCMRMDEIAPGLRSALSPGWRGGRTMRVLAEGRIAIGDPVRIEDSLAEAI